MVKMPSSEFAISNWLVLHNLMNTYRRNKTRSQREVGKPVIIFSKQPFCNFKIFPFNLSQYLFKFNTKGTTTMSTDVSCAYHLHRYNSQIFEDTFTKCRKNYVVHSIKTWILFRNRLQICL